VRKKEVEKQEPIILARTRKTVSRDGQGRRERFFSRVQNDQKKLAINPFQTLAFFIFSSQIPRPRLLFVAPEL
jgi:hypothetical protein